MSPRSPWSSCVRCDDVTEPRAIPATQRGPRRQGRVVSHPGLGPARQPVRELCGGPHCGPGEAGGSPGAHGEWLSL